MYIVLAEIAANNYVYLHDLLWNTNDAWNTNNAWILLSIKSYVRIVTSVLVIL
jgi:hypothetical protein